MPVNVGKSTIDVTGEGNFAVKKVGTDYDAQFYDGAVKKLHHGALGGLADDDHTQYRKEADGDVIFWLSVDPAAWDYDEGDLTLDGAWHDLDLSAKVPAGATAVFLSGRIKDNLTGTYIMFRKNGNTNAYNVQTCRTQVANVRIDFDLRPECDTDRKIEYMGVAGTNEIEFLVEGYTLG